MTHSVGFMSSDRDPAQSSLSEVLQRWRGRLCGKLPAKSVDEFIDKLRGERLDDEAQSEESKARGTSQ